MSDTPRVDAAKRLFGDYWCEMAVPVEFAEELERINAQMLEALEACAAYWHYKRSPGIPEHSELVSLSAEQAQKLIRAAIAAAKGGK